MNTDPAHRQPADKGEFKRGPNTEAVDTAQKNVTEGYGSAGKASHISAKPDKGSDASAGRPEDQGKASTRGQ